MIISEFLPATPNRLWDYASQLGVTHAICKCASELTGLASPDNFEVLSSIQKRFAERGFTLCGLEGDQFDMQRIKLGLPGREEDIEKYYLLLENMGKLGIKLLCYNFMAGIGWHRSKPNRKLRGGALTTSFDLAEIPQELTEAGEVSVEAMWDNYQWFIERVLPVAQKNGIKMALHPDDPPIPSLRGIARIFSSPEGIRKAMALSESSSHCLTYCQANYKLMGDDEFSLINEFGSRIAFVHFRDVEGCAENFYETFHDNGPTNMPEIIGKYLEEGFDGPIRVDHVPTMAGEDNDTPGYASLGRLFAIGYLKGILHTLKSPVC